MQLRTLLAWLPAFAGGALGLIPGVANAQAYDSTMFRALQWRNVVPDRGGRATTGVGVPGNPRIYYMGATGGGLWKTEDAGGSWRNISDGFFGTGSIGDIAVVAANPSVVYVGTGEAPVRGMMSSYGDGMYKSIDAGRTWTHIGLEKTRQISRVVVHPADANVLYVAAQGSRWAPTDDRGIYRSTDGGATWSRILFVSQTAGASELEMDPTNPRVLYATFWDLQRTAWSIRSGGPGSGVWKSTDGGDTWTQLKNGLPSAMGRIGFAIARATPDRLYALVEADSGGMYRSDDAGASWRRVSGNRLLLARPWYFMSVTVDPGNSDVVYAPGFSFLRSTDGGSTFVTRPSPHSDNHRLWISPTDTKNMILAHDGGATISFDGGDTWTTDTNQPTAQFYALQTDSVFPYNLYGGQQDGSSVRIPSRDVGGDTFGGMCHCWKAVGGGESARFAFNPTKPDVIFATGFLGELHRYDERTGLQRSVTEFPGGQHLGSSSADMPYRFNWSAPLTWSPFDSKVMYHGANVLFRSIDGDHWEPMSPDLTRNDIRRQGRSGPFWHDGSGGEIYNTIYSIVESPRERGTIWVGTDDGLVQLTRDNGRSWKNVTPPGWGEGLVYTIDVGHHANGTAYVAFSRHKWDDYTPHYYVTRDYGRTWTDLATSLPKNHPARVIREDPVRKDLLLAGTEYGLWISFNGGREWQSFQRGVPVVPVSDIQIHHDDLIVATEGRGFWVLDDMTPLRQMTPALAAAKLHLFQSTPAVRLGAGARSGGLGGSGAIRYSLGAALIASDTLQLDIVNAAGAVIRHVTSAGGGAGAGRTAGRTRGRFPDSLGTTRGLNQFMWDLRGRATTAVEVHAMPSGMYTVRMTLGGTTVSQPLRVEPDPRAGGTPAAEREHAAMVETLVTMAADINRTVAAVRSVRTQARALLERGRSAPVVTRDAALRSLIGAIDSLEATVVTQSGGGGIDIMHFTPELTTDVGGLLSAVEGSSAPVTSGEREQLARLRARASTFHRMAERVLTTDVARVNVLVTNSGLTPPITRPQSPR
jgi:photosystem II stability/assembly factor-like uncharacterized protein